MTSLIYERAKESCKLQASNYKLLIATHKFSSFKLGFPTIKNKIVSWAQKQLIARRLASIAMLTVLIPVTVVPAMPKAQVPVDEVHVKLDTNTASLLVVDRKMSEIKPGEAKIEREIREKNEAEARARAEAEAKAKAEAEAKTRAVLTASRNTVTREKRVYADPSDFGEIYVNAGNAYGVDPTILRAIHQVETGGSGSTGLTNRSGSGAQGPMQFMPSTWRRHGVDGDSDGVADINNVTDAIFSAAKYLKDCGYPNVKQALRGYNPSSSYYNRVLSLARSYGFEG